MTAGAPPLAPTDTARDFLAPAVWRAVASLRLPAGAWVLDAGTGSGGALPALARAAGRAGRVRGVDLDPAAVQEARAYVGRHGIQQVSVETADALETAGLAATDPGGGFDAIWAAELVARFERPATAVAVLAEALRPGGVLALFCANEQQAVLMPGHARLERLARAALDRHARAAVDASSLLPWLRAAGLERLTLEAFPRVAFRADADPTAREHLEATVWPRLRAAVAADPSVDERDRADLLALSTPGGPRYALDEPGWYVLQPTIVATGRRGRAGRR
ncbi:MAG TPA: class I SAM-dependent methyltransferase [Pseudonocardia sp.]|nr:class I SAM-dependent methyltransferase [Pseudonocardia sp.]